MDQRVFEKALELVKKSQKVLLVTRTHPCDDSIAALLGLGLAFERMSKDVDMVCGGPVASRLSFLPRHGEIGSSVENENHFVISVDTSRSKVSQFSYDFDDDGNRLNIYLTPDGGMFDEDHVKMSPVDTSHDLIVVVDAYDFDSLGDVYVNNKRRFFETPVIVLDSSSKNALFGDVNIIDSKALSASEVAYQFVKYSCGEDYIDKHVASAFLAGIVSKTHSFQSGYTTPLVFSIAGELIEKGADQQHIIRSMYKNKSLETLRLWGQVLLSLEHDVQTASVLAVVRKRDLSITGTSYEHITGLHDELLSYVGDARKFILFIEFDDGMFEVRVRFDDLVEAEKFGAYIGGDVVDDSVIFQKKSFIFEDLKVSVLHSLRDYIQKSHDSLVS